MNFHKIVTYTPLPGVSLKTLFNSWISSFVYPTISVPVGVRTNDIQVGKSDNMKRILRTCPLIMYKLLNSGLREFVRNGEELETSPERAKLVLKSLL